MTEQSALAKLWERADEGFFRKYPSRKAHIRNAYKGESEGEFWTLGPHDIKRRRIIFWRVPADNPFFDAKKQPLLKLPFLSFQDETIEDNDTVLLPIIHQIMLDAKERYR